MLKLLASSQLRGQVVERQRLLEEARRRQRIQQKTREMRRCLESVRERLLHHEGATDVASAVALLEQHQLLRMELEEQRNRCCFISKHNRKFQVDPEEGDL